MNNSVVIIYSVKKYDFIYEPDAAIERAISGSRAKGCLPLGQINTPN